MPIHPFDRSPKNLAAKVGKSYTCVTRMVEQFEPEAYKVGKLGKSGGVWESLTPGAKEEARRARIFKQDVTEWLVAQSLGADISQVALHRYIPTEIHVATATLFELKRALDNFELQHALDLDEEIVRAFESLLIAAGFEPLDDSAPKFGSIHWKGVHRTRSRKSVQQLDERLALVEVSLTKAFIGQGAQVNGLPNDRAEVEKTEAERRAELQKIRKEIEQAETEIQKSKAEAGTARAETERIKAETEKVKAETKKINLESKKTLLELAHTLAKALVKASAGFAIIIGTLHISAPPPPHAAKPATVFKIETRRLDPNQATEGTGSVWLRAPEKKAFGVEDEEHDPLDSE
jgi:hypothetical protein